MQMGGHYIFYEKNPAMQNYMISTRKKIGVSPSEVVEDRAAKDFRNTVRERMESRNDRSSSRFVLYHKRSSGSHCPGDRCLSHE